MKILINKQNIDLVLENEKTLADLLASFQKSFDENKAALLSLKIDDRILNPEDLKDFMKKPLDSIKVIEMETITLEDIQKVLKSFVEQLDSLKNKFLDIGFLYQSNKDTEASAYISQFADFFSNFSKTISLLSLFPECFNELKLENENILDYLANFSKILIDFEAALENNDRVLLGDLAEYEIAPVLESLAGFCKTL